MSSLRLKISQKQAKALELLRSYEALELAFGGGARGGKSFLGALWIILSCVSYPKSQWLIGREELKNLKRTTMRTFFEVLRMMEYKKDEHFTFNAQDMVLEFWNGSTVFFAELKSVPSDPQFDRLGSYDLSGYWIDEAQEVSKEAKDTLQARLTLLSGEGWKVKPKALFTCNPGKGWIMSDFWRPYVKEKKQRDDRYFITSLFTDNPWIDHEEYRRTLLGTKNKVKIERLLYGNFEYDDEEGLLFERDAVMDLRTNSVKGSEKYLSADIARTGDKIVLVVWEGLRAVKVYAYRNKKIPETVSLIAQLSAHYSVPRSHVIIDADGMGVGVLDYLPGAKAFHGGGSPQGETGKFKNLRAQCFVEFARAVNAREVGIGEIGDEEWDELVEELGTLKQTNIHSDQPVAIIPKEKIKDVIGRSPDVSDAFMMRFLLEVVPKQKIAFHPL